MQTATYLQFPTGNELMSHTWNAYKQKFTSIVQICAVPVVVSYLIILMFSWVLATFSVPDDWVVLSGAMVVSLVLFTLFMWAFAALVYNLNNREHSPGLLKSYMDTSKYILPLSIAVLLDGLLMAVVIALLSILAMFIPDSLGGTFADVRFIVAFMLLPGLLVWFSQSKFVIVTDNVSAVEAMKRSRAYVHGNFGQLLRKGLYLWLCLLLLVIGGAMVGLLTSTLLPDFGAVEGFLLMVVSVFVFSPLATIYSWHLFTYLKASKSDTTPRIAVA